MSSIGYPRFASTRKPFVWIGILAALSPGVATGAATLNISSPSITEGDSGTKILTFDITCDPCDSVNAIVDWATADGTATTADNDYVASTGQIDDFGNGTAVETYPIEVTINGDTTFEADETFELRITNASVGLPSLVINSPGIGTILNDDAMNSPPTADAGPDQTVECAAPGGTAVTLDGTGSSDPDGDSLTYSWTGPFGTASGPMPTVSLPLGVHVVTLEVDDGVSGTDTDTVQITIQDTAAPVITLEGSASMTLECNIDGYTEPGATAVDACEGTVPVSISGSVDTSTLGTYLVTYTASDSSSNTDSETRTVEVVDTTPPEITLNGDDPMTLECNVDTYVEPGAVVTDLCDPAPTLDITGSVDESTPGSYTITYTATDASGNTAVAERTVEVVDTIPPEITVAADPIVLWPPNHKHRTVDLADVVVAAEDLCDADVSADDVVIDWVASDEEENGAGDGNTVDDVLIGGDCRSVELRAERQGGSNGRVYTLALAVADASGNVGTASFPVWVPHEKKGDAVDDGAVYAVAGGCAVGGATLRFEGRVVDALDGRPLDGVRVRLGGAKRVQTDDGGRYGLDAAAGGGAREVILRRQGYYPRTTYLETEKSSTGTELGLIPRGGGFRMDFFDQVLRGWGGDLGAGTRRWVEEPIFELYGRFLETAGAGLRAGEWLPESTRRLLEETIRADVPRYTGGVLRGDRIRWLEPQRGERVAETSAPAGVIRVAVESGDCAGTRRSRVSLKWSKPGILEGGRIELFADCGGAGRASLSHALAHHLGFAHGDDRSQVPAPSIMGLEPGLSGPSEADALHGRLLYRRFPGNRGPDRDPHPGSAGEPRRRALALECGER